MASFYAHHNNRSRAGEIFEQALHPKFGNGPEVIIGADGSRLANKSSPWVTICTADIKARGYTYVESMASLVNLDQTTDRVIALFDDGEFDFNTAVQQAVSRLSRNPKGFLLIAHSDCHTGKSRTSLQRLLDLDKAVAVVAEQRKKNRLILFTADHGYDLRIKGEALTETARSADHTRILAAVARRPAYGRRSPSHWYRAWLRTR